MDLYFIRCRATSVLDLGCYKIPNKKESVPRIIAFSRFSRAPSREFEALLHSIPPRSRPSSSWCSSSTPPRAQSCRDALSGASGTQPIPFRAFLRTPSRSPAPFPPSSPPGLHSSGSPHSRTLNAPSPPISPQNPPRQISTRAGFPSRVPPPHGPAPGIGPP